MKRMIGFIVMALLVMLVPSLVGCIETQYESGGSKPATEKLQIIDHHMTTSEYGSMIVKGRAKNISSSNLSYASVKVKFYDASGTLLATSSDGISDLGLGETWSFSVMYFGMDDENVKSYKIGVGSTW